MLNTPKCRFKSRNLLGGSMASGGSESIYRQSTVILLEGGFRGEAGLPRNDFPVLHDGASGGETAGVA